MVEVLRSGNKTRNCDQLFRVLPKFLALIPARRGGHGLAWVDAGPRRDLPAASGRSYAAGSFDVCPCTLLCMLRAAYGLGGLEVDDKLEFCRLHNRQIGELLTLENSADIDAHLSIGTPSSRRFGA